MKATKKNLKLLSTQLKDWEAKGMLESGQVENARRALKRIELAAKTKNAKGFNAALNDFARAFCNV